MKKLTDIGEFGLIEEISKQVALNPGVIKGIGDDAAVVATHGRASLLLTTDMLLEGVHFTKTMPARAIGHKALACSISDIAAMGGLPKYAVVSIGVNKNLPLIFTNELYAGINALAKRFGVAIVGGDTVKSDKIIINVALVGEAHQKDVVYRSGAKPGNLIFVTGRLGGSFNSGHHLRFTPRIKESQYLVKHYKPAAMIDISDGLAADLGHILKESHVGAVLEEEDIPLNSNTRVKNALYDGEDFELLFTLSKDAALALGRKGNQRFNFICIGEIVKGTGVRMINRQGFTSKVRIKGFEHF